MSLKCSSRIIGVIGLSEIRLDEKVRESDVNIHGYNIYRNDHESNGGGVAIYVKESLHEPTVKVITDKLELIELEFNPIHAKPCVIISWYRHPASGADDVSFDYLRDLLKEADKEERKRNDSDW